MEQPRKRTRTAICPCSVCNGRERDYRTVESHMNSLYNLPTSGDPSTMVPLSLLVPVSGTTSSDDECDDSPRRSIASEDTSPSLQPASLILDKERVHTFVMKEVKAKLDHGSPVSIFEESLNNVSTLLPDIQLPTKWNEVLQLMTSLGYTRPTHYKVCASQDHSFLLLDPETHPACPTCSKPRGECIDYYCLGLNFREWFLTVDECDKLICHWIERADWFNVSSSNHAAPQTELWHGKRFQELSWFWDPTCEYTLPEFCPHCNRVVPASVITETNFSVECPHCNSSFHSHPRKAHGDPRNQAIIIHEDGWCPFSTSSSNSIAAITITNACMSKLDRADAQNARLYSFIPVSQLPNGAPHKYDAFFEPLIREIEELYIEGEEVYFRAPVPGFSDGDCFATLRLLPLLITADSKAHHEIGLTSAGGVRGCRRCTVKGECVPERRHYYYGNFLARYWDPCPASVYQSDATTTMVIFLLVTGILVPNDVQSMKERMEREQMLLQLLLNERGFRKTLELLVSPYFSGFLTYVVLILFKILSSMLCMQLS